MVNTNDEAPEWTDDDDAVAVSVVEGATTVGSYDVTDADTSDLFNDISTCTDTGADADIFTSAKVDEDTCSIAFTAAEDYESADDVGGDNIYNVNLIVNDGVASDSLALTITINDTNDDAPEWTDADDAVAVSEVS